MQAAYLKNVRAEGLEPGQQPLQRRKIGKLAVQHGLDGLYGGGEVLKIKQRLGRENPGNADLIMRWLPRLAPQLVGTGQSLDHKMPRPSSRRATRTG